MKKKLFFLAVAAVALASCSNDETIASQATSQANEISFRPLMTGVTRANDQTQSALEQSGKGFYVTAKHNATASQEGGSDYFDNAHYTYNQTFSNYTCSDKYYWPGSGFLNFYAYAPAEKANEIARTAYNTFTITPNGTAALQEDFIYGVVYDQTKTQNGAGVTLNFHHAQSKVSIKARNTSTLAFTIGTVTLCQVSTTGTFTYTNAATNISNGKLTACWSGQSGSSAYANTPYPTTFAAGASESQNSIVTDMILIPQTIAPVAGYSSASQGVGLATTGSFIKIQIKATQGGQYVVGDDNTFVDAIWPLPSGTWAPGYHYTYTVDLGGGGYYTTNQNDNINLDPIIAGSEIIFTTVTVDSWTDQSTTYIPNPNP